MATKNINIRIPDALHALIKASAEADRRSLNSQIIWLIEAGIADQCDGRSGGDIPAGQRNT